jgi:hypothetical protein
LAVLDIEAFKNTVEKSRELNEKVKAYIRQNADKMFEDLDKKTGQE